VFERLIPAGGIANEAEALLWYAVAALLAGELVKAEDLSERLVDLAAHRSPHTRQHSLSLTALLHLARGAWDQVTATTQELEKLVEANPDTGFCLLGAAAASYGAIAEIVAGRPIPERLDAFIARLVDESVPIQATSAMVPKVMANLPGILPGGMEAYRPGLRLWDRARAWDVCDLMPAIALTMLERWDELGPTLARLDEFAAGGGQLAAAVAAAIREEAAAGRPPPASTGCWRGLLGISELLPCTSPLERFNGGWV
jgi:hypothetical protein